MEDPEATGGDEEVGAPMGKKFNVRLDLPDGVRGKREVVVRGMHLRLLQPQQPRVTSSYERNARRRLGEDGSNSDAASRAYADKMHALSGDDALAAGHSAEGKEAKPQQQPSAKKCKSQRAKSLEPKKPSQRPSEQLPRRSSNSRYMSSEAAMAPPPRQATATTSIM